jgi:pyruvate-formate lyase-activating enzyme
MSIENPGEMRLLLADRTGAIYDDPEFRLLGAAGSRLLIPAADDLIPLPAGSRLFYLPGCPALGYDTETGAAVVPDAPDGGPAWAVAAFLPPAYTRLLLPAADYREKDYHLPLWAYTAVGWDPRREEYVTAAVRVDENRQWEPDRFDDREVLAGTRRLLARFPKNRLVRHLRGCALENHCFAAKNFFLGRWECPLPVSPACNARCLGCLSLQEADGCTASHDRLDFVPTVEELLEVALTHVAVAENPVFSFGQGCEGDPILEAETIGAFIRRFRAECGHGTLNVNTNASLPDRVAALAKAGLDAIRVSLNSPLKERYLAYYRPRNYAFEDVLASLRAAKDGGLHLAVNLLVMPGVTDDPREVDALCELIQGYRIDQVQMRNLNIDPQLYLAAVGESRDAPIGIRALLALLRAEFPGLEIGYFNRFLR